MADAFSFYDLYALAGNRPAFERLNNDHAVIVSTAGKQGKRKKEVDALSVLYDFKATDNRRRG
jgi:hypothetical protein